MFEENNQENADAIDSMVSDIVEDVFESENTEQENKEVEQSTTPENTEEVQKEDTENEENEIEEDQEESEDETRKKDNEDKELVNDLDEAENADEDNDSKYEEVVINGISEKVSIDDLKKGYMRQQDYTKKTQEVAERSNAIAILESDIKKKEEQVTEKLAYDVSIGKLAVDNFFKEALQDGSMDEYSINDLKRKFDINYRESQNQIAKQIEEQEIEIQKKRAKQEDDEILAFLQKNPQYKEQDKANKFKEFINSIISDAQAVPLTASILEACRLGYEGQQLKKNLEHSKKTIANRKVKKPIPKYQPSSNNSRIYDSTNTKEKALARLKQNPKDNEAILDYIGEDFFDL